MTLCNVGSRKNGPQDDFSQHGWGLFVPNLTIYGFDADQDACDLANDDLEHRQITWYEEHIPLALSNEAGAASIYVTHHPMCSSLYPPNEVLLKRFHHLIELAGFSYKTEIETTTLDLFCQQREIPTIDFLQIDVQGADLKVLQGASQTLKNIFVVQIEVEFSPLHVEQLLFADVDQFLRARGFTLFDLGLARRIRASSPIHSNVHPGQVLWGEAYYIRDLLQPAPNCEIPNTPENLFKLACIADTMDFTDYALEILEHLTLHHSEDHRYNVALSIIEALQQFPALAEQGIDSVPIVARLKQYLDVSQSGQL